jgi:Tfp pilus assembly protein PilZ
MVRYGIDKTDRTGFTRDLSETGLFIKTNTVFKPGTTIQVELTFPDRTFYLWARVVWAKKVPPQLAHVLECGMGISFANPDPEWSEYYRGLVGS